MPNTPNPQERIARERYHDAMLVIVDGEGSAHYWSRYAQALVVVDTAGDVLYDLAFPVEADDGTVIDSPAAWLTTVRERVGVETHRISRSLLPAPEVAEP
jgi:hypothetical protein